MRGFLLAALVSTCSSILVENQFVDDTHVLILNDKNFSDVVKEHPHLLVDFYAPWCGYCQHLAPALARAAKMVAEQAPGSGCRFAKVDVTANDQLSSRFKDQFEGFPTLLYFHYGQTISKAQVPHNDATIARWLLKQASFDTVTHLTTVAEIRAFEKRAEIAVLAFGDDASAERLAQFKQLVVGSEWPATIRFAIADVSLVDAFADVKASAPCLVLVRGSHWRKEVEVGKLGSAVEMSLFLKQNLPPPEVLQRLLILPHTTLVVLLGTKEHEAHEHPERWVFDRAAKGLGMYFHADVILDHASLTWFGVESSDLPRLAVVKVSSGSVKRVEVMREPLLRDAADKEASIELAKAWLKPFTPVRDEF